MAAFVKAFVFISLLLPVAVHSLGRHNFECPDGFYLNSISSMFGGDHRMYTFGCAPLINRELTHEKCQPGRISASSVSDMYMSCENHQYVAGVSIVEDSKQQLWTLLCCHSTEISIDESCTSTTFLNEYKKGFAFASGAKHVLRKWQSVYDDRKKDRRWWLQTCPFAVVEPLNITSKTSRSMNFRRRVKFPFEENRIEEVQEESNEHEDNSTFVISQNSLDVEPVIAKIVNTSNFFTIFNTTIRNRTTTSTVTLKPSLSSLSASSASLSSATEKTSVVTNSTDVSLKTTGGAKKISNNYDDYYEPEDSSRTKPKPNENSSGGGGSSSPQVDGIFKELHKVFKNIQDGLVLAQWVLSNDDSKKQSNSGDKNGLQQTSFRTAKPSPKFAFGSDKENEINRRSDALLPSNSNGDLVTVAPVTVNDKPKPVLQSFAEFVGLCPTRRRSW